MPKPIRTRKPTKSLLINKNDALAREINLRLHANRCARCGRSGDLYQLHWSHVFGRGSKIIRWDEDNAMTHCYPCHKWWHENPLNASEWFENKYPGRKSRLQAKLNLAHPMKLQDYIRINEELKRRLEQLTQEPSPE